MNKKINNNNITKKLKNILENEGGYLEVKTGTHNHQFNYKFIAYKDEENSNFVCLDSGYTRGRLGLSEKRSPIDLSAEGIYHKKTGLIYEPGYNLRRVFICDILSHENFEDIRNEIRLRVNEQLILDIKNNLIDMDINQSKKILSSQEKEQIKECVERLVFNSKVNNSKEDFTFPGNIDDNDIDNYLTIKNKDSKKLMESFLRNLLNKDKDKNKRIATMIYSDYIKTISDKNTNLTYAILITKAIKESKARTVNVTVCKEGKEITVKMGANWLQHLPYNYEYSSYDIIGNDLKKYESLFGIYDNDIHVADVKEIKYRRKTLYLKE